MKKKTTIITEEFDKDGNLVNRTTETTEEEDSGYIYPQQHYPYWNPYEVTCTTGTLPTENTFNTTDFTTTHN